MVPGFFNFILSGLSLKLECPNSRPERCPLLLYFIFTCASLKPSHALLLIPFPLFFGPHFYISLPGAANRPFQIPLCPGTKAAQMWEGLALGKLRHCHPDPAGRRLFHSGTRGTERKGDQGTGRKEDKITQ